MRVGRDRHAVEMAAVLSDPFIGWVVGEREERVVVLGNKALEDTVSGSSSDDDDGGFRGAPSSGVASAAGSEGVVAMETSAVAGGGGKKRKRGRPKGSKNKKKAADPPKDFTLSVPEEQPATKGRSRSGRKLKKNSRFSDAISPDQALADLNGPYYESEGGQPEVKKQKSLAPAPSLTLVSVQPPSTEEAQPPVTKQDSVILPSTTPAAGTAPMQTEPLAEAAVSAVSAVPEPLSTVSAGVPEPLSAVSAVPEPLGAVAAVSAVPEPLGAVSAVSAVSAVPEPLPTVSAVPEPLSTMSAVPEPLVVSPMTAAVSTPSATHQNTTI